MASKRDSLFPATSIGRSQGASITRSASRENLVAHPLLSPGPSTTSSPALTSSPDTTTQTSSAKYVPYTPRQRPTTTGTTAPLPVPQPPQQPQPQSGAGGKAQLVNLKAQVQAMGLDAGSVGWSILEKLSHEADSSEEWSEIWNAVTKGRATLLLPSDQAQSHESITPDFVQDHVIICDLASRENTPVVTLSGLRGQLVNDVLTFRSTLPRTTKQFQELFAASSSRASALDALPPLPHYPEESSYPSFTLSGFSASLTLPARSTKPPLPPRPGVGRSTTTQSSARLSMPFASLFGQRPSTPPITNASLPPPTNSPASQSSEIDQVVEISAFTITSTVSRKDISNAIVAALKAEIAVALTDQPPWILERVQSFALPFFPFLRTPAGKKKLHDIGGNKNRVWYAVNGMLDKPDELADKFQEFYRAVESELRDGRHAHVDSEKDKEGEDPDTSNAQDQEKPAVEDEDERDARIRGVLEIIESTLCTLLYDRLFLPSTSDDASHDEALSSRIAALNMLDLGLEHLDIDIGNANYTEVDQVVRTCGQTLAQLDISGRSPRDKAAILVSAHKLVVEGLSKIPPIRLKSGDDKKENVTKPPVPADFTDSENTASTDSSVNDRPAPTSESTEKRSPLIPTVTLTTSSDHPTILKPPPSPEIVPSTISSPVSGDVLLPVIIFSVVKANPAKLVSHLLYTQRFRNQSFGGEESYCLINLMAVAEFLENVDLGALGLGESEKKVISTADLTPISITRPNMTPESPIAVVLQDDHSGGLRGRVEQGVDAIAGSANKVISGVVDSSFGVLRAFLPVHINANNAAANSSSSNVAGVPPGGSGEATDSALWSVRPGLGLLRRETGFSIAGLAAALPGQAKAKNHTEEDGQRELVEVSSRPPSVRSHKTGQDGSVSEQSDEEGSEEGESDNEEESEEGVGEEEAEDEEVHDTRSIKSFESMLSSGRSRRKSAEPSSSSKRRKALTDLTDRLAHGMAGMSRRGRAREQGESHKANSPKERLTALPPHSPTTRTSSSPSVNASVPTISIRFPPPNRRFLECTEQDIRVSEVGELLREYQQLVEAVRNAGGFHD